MWQGTGTEIMAIEKTKINKKNLEKITGLINSGKVYCQLPDDENLSLEDFGPLNDKPLKTYTFKVFDKDKLRTFELFSRLATYNGLTIDDLLNFVMSCFNTANKPPYSLVTEKELLEKLNTLEGLPRKITRQDLYTWRKSNKLQTNKAQYWFTDGNFVVYNLPAMQVFVQNHFGLTKQETNN